MDSNSLTTSYSRGGSWPVGVWKILHLQRARFPPSLQSGQRLRAAVLRQTPVYSSTSAGCTSPDLSSHSETTYHSQQRVHHRHHHHIAAEHQSAFHSSNNNYGVIFHCRHSTSFREPCTNKNPNHLHHFPSTQLYSSPVVYHRNHQDHSCLFSHDCTALHIPYPSSHHPLNVHNLNGWHREQQTVP